MKKEISAIIFDLGGVILNLDYQKTSNAFQALSKVNVSEVYTQANQVEVFDQFETGSITPLVFRKKLAQLLQLQISDEIFDKAWNAMLLDLPKERIELLTSLSKRYRIFLFSNTNTIHYNAFRKGIKETYKNADLLETIFEKTYYSHILGERKPTATAFQKIMDEQQLNPSTTLFIDDSIQHIKGAEKVGLRTIHLKDMDILDACNYLMN